MVNVELRAHLALKEKLELSDYRDCLVRKETEAILAIMERKVTKESKEFREMMVLLALTE